MKRSLIFVLIFVFITASVFSQNRAQPWWLSLERGKQQFRVGEYGDALISFEDARRNRLAMYEQAERDLIALLSINEVRRIGDSLEYIERYSKDRFHQRAYAAFQELYYRVPKASLNNSAKAALEAVGRLKDYPEAEYWIGEVYRVEGELPLALSQFRKAYAMKSLAENPGFGLDLQYKIAGILLTRQEYLEMIKVLDSIISEHDTLWINGRQGDALTAQNASAEKKTTVPYAQASASFASNAMGRTLETEGVNRFLELFRYNNALVEPAHRRLGFHYAVTGRPLAQQHLTFAFLIQNTIIIDEIIRRKFDFTLDDGSDRNALVIIAENINNNPLLLSYIEEVEYYKTVYYLASSLYRNGKPSVARNLWSFLASQTRAGEWQNRAIAQVRNPTLDPVVEMP
jgi:tetratricopeptide (TPR) repeat protein